MLTYDVNKCDIYQQIVIVELAPKRSPSIAPCRFLSALSGEVVASPGSLAGRGKALPKSDFLLIIAYREFPVFSVLPV